MGIKFIASRFTLLCAAALLAGGPGIAQAPRSPVEIAPLFTNGTGGYTCYRIPAIIRTPDGTLLAFAEARQDSCADFGTVRIVVRRSRDGGRTWSPMATVADNGALKAGNPSPVVDTLDPRYPKGRIFLLYTTTGTSEAAVLRGQGAPRVWYRASTDDGATWAAPVEITASVKLEAWRYYATGPGHALQLSASPHRGRILAAANHTQGAPLPDGQAYVANTFFSDDHGRSWHVGGTVDAPGSNESTLAQRADGSVIMNSRDQGNSHARIISISPDGGEHWTASFVAGDLPDPRCEGSLIAVSGPGKSSAHPVLLFSNAGDRARRWNLTISVSTDGGRTWPGHTVIYAGPSAYSDLVALPGARLGILFERGNVGGIVFLTRPIRPLLDPAPAAVPAT